MLVPFQKFLVSQLLLGLLRAKRLYQAKALWRCVWESACMMFYVCACAWDECASISIRTRPADVSLMGRCRTGLFFTFRNDYDAAIGCFDAGCVEGSAGLGVDITADVRKPGDEKVLARGLGSERHY